MKLQAPSDLLQYWAGLLILQIIHNNMPCCAIAVDAGAPGILVKMVHLGEKTQETLQRGGDPFSSQSLMRRLPVRDHVLVVCLQALRALVAVYLDAHAELRAAEREADRQAAARELRRVASHEEEHPRGPIACCCAIIHRGRQQHYPVLDAAMRLAVTLTDNPDNSRALMAAGLPLALRVHTSANTAEGLAAQATMAKLSEVAVLMLQKTVRGHAVRVALRRDSIEMKKLRLARFYALFKMRAYWKRLRENRDKNQQLKTFMARLFGRQKLSLVQRMLENMLMYVEQSAVRADKVVDMHARSKVARNVAWDAWVGHMEGAVATLNQAVERKCKNVIALITGETVRRCFDEWRNTSARARILKRRWLHGALDVAMRAWKESLADTRAIFQAAAARLSGTLTMLTNDLATHFFAHWSALTRRNKVTLARFRNVCAVYAWDLWCDMMSEAMDLVAEVQVKCQKVLALMHADGVRHSFRAWHVWAHLRRAERRVIVEFNQKLLTAAFRALEEVHAGLHAASDEVKLRCRGLIRYLAVGCVEDTFSIWREDTRRNVRARKRWQNQTLTHIWNVWTKEVLPMQRKIARCRVLLAMKEQNFFFHLWRGLVLDKADKTARMQRMLTKWFNREKAEAFEKLRQHATLAVHHRGLLQRIRRTFDLRHARRAMHGWDDVTRKAVRLRQLVLRIKHRVLTLFFEELQRRVDDRHVALRQELFARSELVTRFLKRPMFQAWALWRDIIAERKRRDKVLARLRFRMQNTCAVLAMHHWVHFVAVRAEERAELLRCALADGYRHGTSEELRAAVSAHPIWRKAYSPALLREAAAALLADPRAGASRLLPRTHARATRQQQRPPPPSPSPLRTDAAAALVAHGLVSVPPGDEQGLGRPAWHGASGSGRIRGAASDARGEVSLAVLLALADHTSPDVAVFALRALARAASCWAESGDSVSTNAAVSEEEVLEAAALRAADPHEEVAAAARAVMDAAAVYHLPPRPSPNLAPLHPRAYWARLTNPMGTLARVRAGLYVSSAAVTGKRACGGDAGAGRGGLQSGTANSLSDLQLELGKAGWRACAQAGTMQRSGRGALGRGGKSLPGGLEKKLLGMENGGQLGALAKAPEEELTHVNAFARANLGALAGQDVTGSGDAADERSLSGETPHVEGDEAERSTDPDQQWFWAEAVAWADDQAARTSSLGRVQRTVEDFARGMGLDVSSRRKRRVMRRGMLLPSTSGNGQGPQTPRLSGGARLGGVAGVAGGQRVGVELPAIRPGSHSSL